MQIGATPLHTFTLPVNVDMIAVLRILYAQNEEIVLIKQLSDCTLEGTSVEVELSQQDTFKFDADYAVEIQVRVKTTDGKSLVSGIKRVTAKRCLENEVI